MDKERCTHDLNQKGEYIFQCKLCKRNFGINTLVTQREELQAEVDRLKEDNEELTIIKETLRGLYDLSIKKIVGLTKVVEAAKKMEHEVALVFLYAEKDGIAHLRSDKFAGVYDNLAQALKDLEAGE